MALRWTLALAALLVASVPAAAEEPARLRLLAGPVGPDGHARAALAIDLAPGWKTYWRDPGEAGLPPSIDLSASPNLARAVLHFPVPHRADDGMYVSNVYSRPIAIALDIVPRDPAAKLDLSAKVSIGVCQDVCIPLAATLTAELVPADDPTLAAAFDAVPAEATAGHGPSVASLSPDGKQLSVTVKAPAGGRPDLFVAGPTGWSFGPPTDVRAADGGYAFTIPVNSRPRGEAGKTLAIETILTGPGAPVAATGFPVETAP